MTVIPDHDFKDPRRAASRVDVRYYQYDSLSSHAMTAIRKNRAAPGSSRETPTPRRVIATSQTSCMVGFGANGVTREPTCQRPEKRREADSLASQSWKFVERFAATQLLDVVL